MALYEATKGLMSFEVYREKLDGLDFVHVVDVEGVDCPVDGVAVTGAHVA